MHAHFAKAQINGIDLHYRMLGTGLPLLLLHGGLANADYWDNQLPVFAETYKGERGFAYMQKKHITGVLLASKST